ncbi:MAG TPA: 30S ribosomal protein S7 [Candidatus Saccharimonadales bacterium]|nr:30S ribosomal protein S7 [Candidatus Saccharimonadales bacterium]
MPRSGKVQKRKIEGDPVYGSRLISRFTNRLMDSGKKSVAQRVMNGSFEVIKEKKQDPLETFENAIRNVAPKMEVRSRRVGGANYQVPVEVRGDRKEALAIRWIITAASSRPSSEYKTMANKLAAEFMDAAAGTGAAIKKRDDTHRMAEANKAFAHFRW